MLPVYEEAGLLATPGLAAWPPDGLIFCANSAKVEHMSDEWIRASEIAEYVYCRRAWWLRRVGGRASRNLRQMAAGTAFHEAHGQLVQRARQARNLVYVLLALALSFILVWVIRVV